MRKFLVLVLSITVFSVSADPSKSITLNTTGKPPLNDLQMQGFMDRVAHEAFRRIGIKLKTVQLPAERGLLNANAGIEDGEMSRIAGLQKIYPNLLQVPEKIMDWEFVAIGRGKIDTNKSWQSLANQNVAIINGWKILEKNVTPVTQVVKVGGPDQLFTMLQRMRTDFILYERWGGAKYLADYSIKDASLHLPPLATREMFIYLHSKHSPIISGLAAAIRDIKQDGTYDKIKQETLGGYFTK